MAQDPSVSADAESPLFPSLSDQEHPSLTRGYLFPETCYNITQTYSTIGPLSGESGTKDVKNLPDKYMCMCINKTAEEGTLFKHKNAPILTVKSEICVGHALSKWKLDHNWKVYESRDTVCVCPLTTERDGNYTAQKNGKTCKFKKSRYLAELTCKVQSCSHEFCGWCPIYPSLLESPMPRVKRSSWKELKLLNCMGDNVVRTESKTVTTPRVVTTPGIVTTPRVLPNAITMVPTRPGISSKDSIAVAVAVVVPISLGLLLLALYLFYKYGVPWMRRRRQSSAGNQDDSHGAAGDMDTQAESFL
ncbi:uncharacterized protein LOC141725681 isoform X4 [Zonotrichia albicollis]|uniref:uncharacterized protein LOC141725681 isoform X4 n=1 Tax=Zonotrichia albicollis TaxID=44394 RepID=UPI003D80DC98